MNRSCVPIFARWMHSGVLFELLLVRQLNAPLRIWLPACLNFQP
jgi:hypothetical protein